MSQNIGLATGRPNGLRPAQVDDLRWALGLLTLHLNTLVEEGIKSTLARVYLGRDPGERVSHGMIEVGNVVAIEGAIWFSDLRDFTSTSERLSPEELIDTLNTYFGALVGPIYTEGGEILKYIGDAVLAIFPTERFADSAGACGAALTAAVLAEERLSKINAARTEPLRHGVGLHYGEARYGNVGSQERLDFTLIGREVNVASRIEGLTTLLGRTVLCSGAFADLLGLAMEQLGQFDLKGVAGKVAILSP
jgi:adenylate cyclase